MATTKINWYPISGVPDAGDEYVLWVPGLGARPAVKVNGRWESVSDNCSIYHRPTHWAPKIQGPLVTITKRKSP